VVTTADLNGWAAWPALLTQDEAIQVLRLDSVGVTDPKESLRHLRRTRQIGYVKVAGKVLIPREEVVAYLERQKVEAVALDGRTSAWSNGRRGGLEPQGRS
jgi:hypothetical protein